MRHDSVVTKWDAILTLTLAGGFLSPLFMSIQILLAVYWTFFASVWVEIYTSPLEIAVIGGMGVLFHLAIFQIAIFLLNVVIVTFTPRMKRGVLGPHSFEIRDSGLSEVTPFNDAFHGWGGVDRVVRLAKRTFVRIGGSNWFVIPDRDFPTPEQAREFYDELRRRSDA
jgi:hypothetical protein